VAARLKRLGPRRWAAVATVVAAAVAATGCAPPPALSDRDGRLQVVTTTALLADLVAHVGGDDVQVVPIAPAGADPHSYEPTLRRARDVVYADVAFSNYLLLEEHNIIKTLDSNLRHDAVNISLAEDAVKYAADIIPMVENVNLDTIWLGLRVAGDGEQYGADRTSDVLLNVTGLEGPGRVVGYLTGSFGDTEVYFDSADGFDAGDGYRDDTATLPADAHTHMSWVFTEPGVYHLDVEGRIRTDPDEPSVPVAGGTVTFAVGVPPDEVDPGATVLEDGHADVAVNLDTGAVEVHHDPEDGTDDHGHAYVHPDEYAADEVVIDVPAKALAEVPGDRELSFLGDPGDAIYQLPQAVLGKHVHGEIDPHLWQNVRNVMSYVELIRDTLIDADPDHAVDYRDRADAYLAELDALDTYVRETIASIPVERRYLVTTHDAFAYLAKAYDVRVGGFVTPNPAAEPSLADRRKLTETVRNLDVPAVFLDPSHAARSSVLTEVAAEEGLEICPIYSDTFSEDVQSYVQMMRFNARSLRECLG
jgi:anchored repeat ABC transporter substrate-binding protein